MNVNLCTIEIDLTLKEWNEGEILRGHDKQTEGNPQQRHVLVTK